MFSLALMALDSRHDYTTKVRQYMAYVVYPVQYAVDTPVRLFHRLQTSVSSRNQLIDENVKLRYEHILLEAKLQRLISLQKENHQLKQLLQSSSHQNGRTLVARIVAMHTNVYRQLLVIDKGSHDGVYVNQAVLDPKGVMGQVIDVGPFTSVLLLVTDPKSAVPVRSSRTGERGIVVGNGHELSLIDLPKTSSIRQGDLLISSGLGQRFPEGYPLGRVVDIDNDAGSAFIVAKVKPAAKINRAQLALLVWPNKKNTVDKRSRHAT